MILPCTQQSRQAPIDINNHLRQTHTHNIYSKSYKLGNVFYNIEYNIKENKLADSDYWVIDSHLV